MRLLFTGRCVRAARARAKLDFSPIPQCALRSSTKSSRWQTTSSAPPTSTKEPTNWSKFKFKPFNSDDPTSYNYDIYPDQPPSATAPAPSNHPDGSVRIGSTTYPCDSTSNITPSILKLLGRRLYDQPNHPITITRRLIESAFESPLFTHYSASHPVVSTTANFDVLGFPADHPGRNATDTYYINSTNVLRTHTSAHQATAFSDLAGAHTSSKQPESSSGYVITADVFRRDSIDRTHFPAFHQMEGARVWPPHTELDAFGRPVSQWRATMDRIARMQSDVEALGTPDLSVSVEDSEKAYNSTDNPRQLCHDRDEVRLVAQHLKLSLTQLMVRIFEARKKARLSDKTQGTPDSTVSDEPLKLRWLPSTFPFTSPSYELEVMHNGAWLELLGCGIIQQPLLHNAGLKGSIGWAWGIGVERIAMLLFDIPDIRLFWSEDPRFLSQFHEGEITAFKPFSKHPEAPRDVSFWIDPAEKIEGVEVEDFHENDLHEFIRAEAPGLVESVTLTDSFVHQHSGRRSRCYRINYRSMEKTLTSEEVLEVHSRILQGLGAEKGGKFKGVWGTR